jgi:hypothetical protein
MVALIVLLVILALLGGLGFAVHVLWFVLIAALLLWVLGFFVGGVSSGMGGRRRWYGRERSSLALLRGELAQALQ